MFVITHTHIYVGDLFVKDILWKYKTLKGAEKRLSLIKKSCTHGRSAITEEQFNKRYKIEEIEEIECPINEEGPRDDQKVTNQHA